MPVVRQANSLWSQGCIFQEEKTFDSRHTLKHTSRFDNDHVTLRAWPSEHNFEIWVGGESENSKVMMVCFYSNVNSLCWYSSLFLISEIGLVTTFIEA